MSVEDHRPNVRDQWAEYVMDQALVATYIKERDASLSPGDELPPPPELDLPKSDIPAPAEGEAAVKVCIIGAGAAGLFTAMLFDYLNISNIPGFHVNYDIFEAGAEKDPASGRYGTGGRLFTYNFSDDPHDYYDVGAMRFPDNPVMRRTYSLFGYLDMQKVDDLKTNPGKGSLIPYYMNGNDAENGIFVEPWRFNDINATGTYSSVATAATPSYDPFQMSSDPNVPISKDVLKYAATANHPTEPYRDGTDGVVYAVMQDLIDGLAKDPKSGFDDLMEHDKYSTTEFLGLKPFRNSPPGATFTRPFNYNTIEWLETFNGGTAWYDQANSETILEFLDFDYPKPQPEPPKDKEEITWRCIMGGAQELAFRMAKSLENGKIQFDSKVKAIDVTALNAAQVSLQGKTDPEPTTYAGVFNSTTLGAMAQMDLTKANLNYGQKQAIRSLGYGASTKVGMKFSTPWWRTMFDINQGGLGHSDLPIRTCVYPSYNIGDDPMKPAVLLCSYQWSQDAQRVATLMSSSKNHAEIINKGWEDELKELVLRNLAAMHANHAHNPMSADEVYKKIAPLYLDHYAHDWYHDENAFGAFAFFRPNQFASMWPYITRSTPSLAIIGEHASPHHAWVVGGLESAVSAVHQWLKLNGYKDAVQAMEQWPELPVIPPPDSKGWIDPDRCNPFAGIPFWATAKQRQWQAVFGLHHEKKFRAAHAKKLKK